MTSNSWEETFYIIKPEGLKNAIAIKNIILKNGLKVITSKETILAPDIIKFIYPDLRDDMLNAHLKYLCNNISEVGIIEGLNAINKLVEISGKDTNPNLCASGTIRNLFGMKLGCKIGNTLYYKNAFHRSRNKDEAEIEVDLFDRIKSTESNIKLIVMRGRRPN